MRTVSFLERDERLHSRFGHLTEGVKSAVTGKPLSEHDQNKMQILMDNLMKDQCCQERINYESIDIAALSEQTATGNIAFVVRNDPLAAVECRDTVVSCKANDGIWIDHSNLALPVDAK